MPVFGLSAFRGDQERIIEAAMNCNHVMSYLISLFLQILLILKYGILAENLLVIMPTGGGKSLT